MIILEIVCLVDNKGIKDLTEFRDLMGERNPLLKSHIFGDEFYGKIFRFRG